MAAPLDVAAQNAALDALLGDGAAAGIPTSFEVALFAGSPALGGTELTATGSYARVTVANDTAHFPDASVGAKTSVTLTFPTSSAAWSDTATHWLLYDHADSVTGWFHAPLDSEVSVDGAGDVVRVELTLFWNEDS